MANFILHFSSELKRKGGHRKHDKTVSNHARFKSINACYTLVLLFSPILKYACPDLGYFVKSTVCGHLTVTLVGACSIPY